jgi:FkbM family methyltransferase
VLRFDRLEVLRRQRRARRLYSRFVSSGSLCFDVGANIGDRTRVLLALGARVVAIEPQPSCVSRLQRIRSDRIMLVPAALGASIGSAQLRLAEASTISSMSPEWIERVRNSGRFADEQWGATITVPVTTLDVLIAEHGRPDFCKIDVEGYERDVIAGLSQPLPLLSFEFVAEYAEATIAVVERLRTLGMREFNYSPGESLQLVWAAWRSSADLLDHLARVSSLSFGDVYARC